MTGDAPVLVTGGSGFIGASLVHRLVRSGRAVRVLDNQSRGNVRRLADVAKDVEFLQGDVRDAEAVRRACRGTTTVCHLASINGTVFFYTKPDEVIDVCIRGMLNVLDACRSEGIRHLLLASSAEVYHEPPAVPTDERAPLVIPDPFNPRFSYAGGKIASELLALHSGGRFLERAIVVRPHNVYGPDMGWEHVLPQFVLRMRARRDDASDPVSFPVQGSGEETRAFLFHEDCAEGMLLLLDRAAPGVDIFHLGNPEETSIAEAARAVGRFYGRRVVPVPGTPAPGSPRRRCPDVSKVAALGFHPRVTFTDGLPRLAEWYDAHAAEAPVGTSP